MYRSYKLKRAIAACMAALLLTAVSSFALAQDTELSVSADATALKAGDAVTITVIVSGRHIAAVEGTFTYDPAVLTYVSGSGGAGDGTLAMFSAEKDGSSSLTAEIKLTATGAGETAVEFSVDKAYDYDEDELGGAKAGVSITVTGGEEADGEGSGGEDAAEPPHIDLTGVPAHNVEGAAEDMYIWRSLNSLTLPSGYADRQVQYGAEYVGGAAIPDTEEPVLLYLSQANGENAGYHIYDADRDMLYPYTTVSSVLASFTLIRPAEDVAIPEGYSAAEFELSDKLLPGWAPEDGDGTVHLIYARNGAGEVGFFLYNSADKSVQRYTRQPLPAAPVPTPQPTPVPEPEPTGLERFMTAPVFIGISALALILLVLTVIGFAGRARAKAKLRSVMNRKRAISGTTDSEM